MGRRSSVRRLPPEIRSELDRLLGDGRYTIAEIVAHMRRLGAALSRSAVGRRKLEVEAVTRRMREMREVAEGFARELGAAPEGQTGRLLIELVQSIVFRFAAGRSDEEAETTAQELYHVARAIRDLEAGASLGAERELKVRREAAKDAAKAATGAARKAGLSPEAIATIERDVLGIAR